MRTLFIPAKINTTYGLLYNWFVGVDARGLAPSGWHVPTDAEWQALGLSYGTTLQNCTQYLKSIGNLEDGTGLWTKYYNNGVYDPSVEGVIIGSSGMNINPSGTISEGGFSTGKSNYSNFWTSNEQTSGSNGLGVYRNIAYNGKTLYNNASFYYKRRGFNYRWIKDNPIGWQIGDTVADIDGNIYPTIKTPNIIGYPNGMIWTTENARVRHYINGDPIPLVDDANDWSNLTTGAIHTYIP